MTLGLSIAGASQEQHVLAGGGLLGELVEGEALAAAGENALAGGLGELQGADLEGLGELQEPHVVGDGGDDGDDLALSGAAVLRDAGQRNGVPVQSALVQPLVDHRVEATLRSAGQEGVELG